MIISGTDKKNALLLLAIAIVVVLIGLTLRAWYFAFKERHIGEAQHQEQLPTDQVEQQRPEFERGTFKGEQAYLKKLIQNDRSAASQTEQTSVVDTENSESQQTDTEAVDTATYVPTQTTPSAAASVSPTAQQTRLEELRSQQETSSQTFESQQSRLEALQANQ